MTSRKYKSIPGILSLLMLPPTANVTQCFQFKYYTVSVIAHKMSLYFLIFTNLSSLIELPFLNILFYLRK